MYIYTGVQYRYMDDLAKMDECRPQHRIYLPREMSQINTPLNWCEWDRLLTHHPDQKFRKFIVEGIKCGFRVGYNYVTMSGTCNSPGNMLSARDKPDIVREYLAKECSEGRVIGPLDPAQFPYVHTSRFGVIPKGISGKWRLIVDMSSPEGFSVNDGIGESLCSLSYVGVEDAVRGICSYGEGTLLAKVDVKSAYRCIPVNPDDRWLMGMMWEGALYVDTTLPFGLRSAPKLFSAVADAVEWIVRDQGVHFVIHYLDDFLVMGAPSSDECATALKTLLTVFGRLGLPVALDKLEGPATHLEFLGFELDSRLLQTRLPQRKLTELKELILQWSGKKSCTKKELESLIGKLGHASRVVLPGKTFMRRMFELLGVAHRAHHKIRLNCSFRSDLEWWATFIESWNGVSMMGNYDRHQAAVHIWTDASGCFGCGALDPQTSAWIQMKWPESHGASGSGWWEESIATKELLPIVLACAIWGTRWSGLTVVVHCDNLGVVAVVNSGYSRVPRIMHLLRCLFFIRAHYQFILWAVHVPGVENILADAISRNNLNYLFSQIPRARQSQSEIPPPLLELLVEQQPDWTSRAWAQLFRTCFLLA